MKGHLRSLLGFDDIYVKYFVFKIFCPRNKDNVGIILKYRLASVRIFFGTNFNVAHCGIFNGSNLVLLHHDQVLNYFDGGGKEQTVTFGCDKAELASEITFKWTETFSYASKTRHLNSKGQSPGVGSHSELRNIRFQDSQVWF